MVDMEVLKLAWNMEDGAVKSYEKLLAGHPNLKDLLYFLMTEEQKHKALIEKKLADLNSEKI